MVRLSFRSFTSLRDRISLTCSLVTTTMKLATTALANSSLVFRLLITAKPVWRIRSYCPTSPLQAIAKLQPTPAKAARSWNTHRRSYPVKAANRTLTVNNARRGLAGSGSSCWCSSYQSSSQEESGIGSGSIGMANLDASGLVIQAVRLMQIDHGSHGRLRRSVLWLLL